MATPASDDAAGAPGAGEGAGEGEVILLVLAAGAGRRLGGVAKALLPAPGGETFLAAVTRAARAGGARGGLVVVGPPHGAAVEEEARRLGLEVAHNDDPDRGMASSVALGFQAARARAGAARAALLWPVDHARVAAATVARLVAAAAADRAVVPTWSGRGGHPAAIGRLLWDELAGCDRLPEGARSVLRAAPDRVRRIQVEDPAVVADVDRPDDLG